MNNSQTPVFDLQVALISSQQSRYLAHKYGGEFWQKSPDSILRPSNVLFLANFAELMQPVMTVVSAEIPNIFINGFPERPGSPILIGIPNRDIEIRQAMISILTEQAGKLGPYLSLSVLDNDHNYSR